MKYAKANSAICKVRRVMKRDEQMDMHLSACIGTYREQYLTVNVEQFASFEAPCPAENPVESLKSLENERRFFSVFKFELSCTYVIAFSATFPSITFRLVKKQFFSFCRQSSICKKRNKLCLRPQFVTNPAL